MNQSGGYGNVYRTYPQAQLQQQPLKLPVGAPAVGLLFLGLWAWPQYARYWPYVESQQRVPRVQVGAPAVGIDQPEAYPWHQYYRLTDSAHFQVPPKVPIPPPVVEAALVPPPTAWNVAQYVRYWPLVESAQRLRLLAIGDPPLPVHGTGFDLAPYLRRRFDTLQRLPTLAPPPPVVEDSFLRAPPTWPWELYYRITDANHFQRLRLLRVGDGPAIHIRPNLLAAYRRDPPFPSQRLPTVAEIVLIVQLPRPPLAWPSGLYYRDFPYRLLAIRTIQEGAPAVGPAAGKGPYGAVLIGPSDTTINSGGLGVVLIGPSDVELG